MNRLISLSAAVLGYALLSTVVSASPIPIQEKNEQLYARLPEDIKKQGKIVGIFDGSTPPLIIVQPQGQFEGMTIDFAKAVGEVLGIEIEHKIVGSMPAMLAGIQSHRYQVSFGAIGDLPERHKNFEFVDLIKESDALIIAQGNPAKIHSIADTCGKRVAVTAGSASEQIIKDYSEKCHQLKQKRIDVKSYPDSPTSALAVRSGRADAVLDSMAPAAYYVGISGGQLEFVRTGIEEAGIYEEFYQGTMLPKDSPLTPILLAAYQQLFDNGTYAAIMKKWHMEANMLPAPGVNLSAKQ